VAEPLEEEPARLHERRALQELAGQDHGGMIPARNAGSERALDPSRRGVLQSGRRFPVSRKAVAAALALLLPLLALAEGRGPSTPEERKRAVEVTRRLERDPLGESAHADRKWIFQWIVEIPDILVTSCNGPLDPLPGDQSGRHGTELFAQSVFGMAAFLVENPKKKDDWVAVQTAGLESVLAAYRSVLKADSEARWPELDELAEAKRKGTLRELVKEKVICRPPGEPSPPSEITI
jgi:hypothetical protein